MARNTIASKAVAAEIRAELARQQLTIAWLASRTGADAASLGRKLGGKRALMVDDVWVCAQALGRPMEHFMAEPATAAA